MLRSPKGTAAVVPFGERNTSVVGISDSFAYNAFTAQGGLYQVLNTRFICV